MQNERVQMELRDDFLLITILSNKSLLKIIFLSLALGSIIFFCFNFFQILSLPKAFLFLLLIIFVICGIKILDMIKWNINGKEVITLSSEKLKIEKMSLMHNSKEYLLEQIKNIRIEPESDSVLRWLTAGDSLAAISAQPEGLIKFNYEKKTIQFAYEIKNEDALKIVEEIKKRI